MEFLFLLSIIPNQEEYINSFSENDFNLSENDLFVIKASALLVQLNGQKLSYDETLEYLITKLTQTSRLITMS